MLLLGTKFDMSLILDCGDVVTVQSRPLGEEKAAALCARLLEGIDYIHRSGILGCCDPAPPELAAFGDEKRGALRNEQPDAWRKMHDQILSMLPFDSRDQQVAPGRRQFAVQPLLFLAHVADSTHRLIEACLRARPTAATNFEEPLAPAARDLD